MPVIRSSINNEISTQLIILQSPSVLMDTFEYVKKENNENKLKFNAWRNRLEVSQERNSSVLNIKYVDSNKEIILPVLQKVSSLYQDYSNKKRLKSLNLEIDYFKNEIEKYKKLAFNSLKKVQSFSKKHLISQVLTTGSTPLELGTVKTDVEINSAIA